MERMEAGQAGATAIGIAECSHAPPGLRLTGRGTGLVQVMVPVPRPAGAGVMVGVPGRVSARVW